MRLTAVLGLVVAIIGLGLARAGTAQAAGVVTTCTEAGFATAWNSGNGAISFSCGASPVVITLTLTGGYVAGSGSYRTIDGANGGNRITLSGGNANRLFDVQGGSALSPGRTHLPGHVGLARARAIPWSTAPPGRKTW